MMPCHIPSRKHECEYHKNNADQVDRNDTGILYRILAEDVVVAELYW